MYKISSELVKECKDRMQRMLNAMIENRLISYDSQEAIDTQNLIDTLEVEYYV